MEMNFKRLLEDATRQTRSGNLAEATRKIQEALGAGHAHQGTAAPRPFVPVPDERTMSGTAGRPSEATARAPDVTRGATVIDGEWRTVEAKGDTRGEDVAPSGDVRARAGRGTVRDGQGTVTRGRHAGRSRELDYRLFVPPLAPDAPPPALVVMLHGCTQDADDFARGTAMDALALEHGFLVLYPEQSGQANAQRCWNWFKHTHQRRGQGEPALIEGAIREVVAAHGIDVDRVFVAGLSAGGAMAAILGDVYPETFRAVGVHSGLAAGAASDLGGALAAMRGGQGAAAPAGTLDAGTRRPPTIVFHGDADRTVHPENGERVAAACLEAARRVSGTAPHAERHEGRGTDRRWTREVYRDAGDAVVVEHWRVHGAAHAWSGGDPRGSYVDATGPDASAEMVRFFLATGGR